MNSRRKEMIAMLLAGGQGSRLFVLTKETAKPAVPFGGKYRIIDFTLSNCINSGIDTVGVLTQYQPLELNTYIGNGQPWDLDRMYGGVHILPPYMSTEKGQWYKGTANAVYQNLHFIEQYLPEYVLILSGDHVYKMDYSKMLEHHKQSDAAVTIATLKVPIEEAPRFGIINTDADGKITGFEEKPANPKSDTASMGVYIFTRDKLRDYLNADEQTPGSKNDFGGDVLPAMLKAGEKMMTYLFEGYWKDVGTIDSLWEANMDLLNPAIPLNLSDPSWRIYSRHEAMIAQYIGKNAAIADSLVSENCKIDGKLWYSVLFSGVTVKKGARLNSAVIMSNSVIGEGADIKYAIIAEDVVIGDGAVIGRSPEQSENAMGWGITVIGKGTVIKPGAVVLP